MRIVHSLHQFRPAYCSIWFSTMMFVSKNIVCVFFASGFRLWSYFGDTWISNHNLSSIWITGGPLCGGAAFTGIVALLLCQFCPAFFGHMVVVLWLDSRKVPPWLCVFFTAWNLVFVRCSCRVFPWLWESSSQGGLRSASSATNCSKSSIWEAYCWWVRQAQCGGFSFR